MSTDKVFPRSVIGGVAALFASAALLTGCATAGPATEGPAETAAETAAPEPTAAPEGEEVAVSIVAASHNPSAQTIEVRSIVDGFIGEGTCTVNVTSDSGEELSASTASLPDAQSTVCPTAVFEGVADGEWTVVVTFEGDEVFGQSEPTLVEEAV